MTFSDVLIRMNKHRGILVNLNNAYNELLVIGYHPEEARNILSNDVEEIIHLGILDTDKIDEYVDEQINDYKLREDYYLYLYAVAKMALYIIK